MRNNRAILTILTGAGLALAAVPAAAWQVVAPAGLAPTDVPEPDVGLMFAIAAATLVIARRFGRSRKD